MNSHDETTAQPVEASIEPPQLSETPATRQTWPLWLGALLLLLITMLAYAPAMRAGFIWDDDSYLYNTEPEVIKAPNGLERIWTTAATPQWYPLVFTTYWFEYRLWGLNPTGYHVVNIVLHGLAAVLLWRILLRLKVPGAWPAAAIFAVHPVHVETVAWITERKNTLSVFFYMLAMLAYLRFANREGVWWYLIALPAFVLALLSKTVTCTLPVAILLALWLGGSLGVIEVLLLVPGIALMSGAVVALVLKYALHIPDLVVVFRPIVTLLEGHGMSASLVRPDVLIAAGAAVGLVMTAIALWRSRRRVSWLVPFGLIPLFVVGLFMGKLTGWYEFHKAKESYWEPMPIGQAFKLSWVEGAEAQRRSEYKLTDPQRAIIAARSLLFYPSKLVVPYPQSFFYHRWSENNELDTTNRLNYWPVAAVLGIGVAVIGLSVIFGRGIFIAFAFFVMTLFPALGFYDTYPMRYSFVADHFQYLASIGLTTLAAAWLTLLFRRLGGTPIPVFNGASVTAGVLALALLAGLGTRTALRCGAYRDEETLWLDTVAQNPHAWGARVNLGILYAKRGNHDKAIEQLQAMIDDGSPWQEAYSNLGNIYALRRDFPKAEALFRKAVDSEPRLADLWGRLAKTLILQNKEAEALAVYERAGKVPRNTYVWTEGWPKLFDDWANLLEKTGQKEAAASKRAYAETLRNEIEAMNPKSKRPPATAAAPATSTAPAEQAVAKIDLGDATTPQERRRAYLIAANDAMSRRDYIHAMQIIQTGCNEFPKSLGLWQRYALMIAASPLDEQRAGKQAVMLTEQMRLALEGVNQLDDGTMEALGAAYAEVGRFGEALAAAKEGLRLAQASADPISQNRLQRQIQLYQAHKPYRLPAPAPTTMPSRDASTPPAPVPTTQRTRVVTTQPSGRPATSPATVK